MHSRRNRHPLREATQCSDKLVEAAGRERIDVSMSGVVNSESDWTAFLTRAHSEPVVAIALQPSGPDPLRDSIQAIQFATHSDSVLLDAEAIGDKKTLRQMLRPLVDTRHYVIAFHNAKPALRYLLALGLRPVRIFDSMLAEQLLSAGEMTIEPTLQESAHRLLLAEITDPRHGTTSHIGLFRQARMVFELRLHLIPLLVEAGLVRCAQIEFECSVVTAAMEQAGICLDTERLTAIIDQGSARMVQATRGFCEAFGLTRESLFGESSLNLHADQQVLAVLQQHGLPVQRVSKDALRPLLPSFPALQYLLDYRKASADRALESYLQAVHPFTGRVHPTYSQLAAATGRYGCSNPNMQSFPNSPEHRACVVPAAGHMLVVADYSQIELRIVAQLSQDPRMLTAFRQATDLHALTASILTDKPPSRVTREERQAAKAVNFGLIYAMGARGLASYARHTYGVEMSLQEATRFRQRFFTAYSGVARWHARVQKERPELVRTLSGRSRRVSQGQLTQALNSPVQGTGADILKQALILLFPALNDMQARIVGVVHDEILVEAPKRYVHEVRQAMSQKMEQATRMFLPDVPCPVQARAVISWGEGE
jgi:DNA polymerase-1